MEKNYVTRSGIAVNEKALPYEIRTSEVEQFLQKKLNYVWKKAKAEEKKKDPNQQRKNMLEVDDISVSVISTQAGKNFYPFFVVLPLDVLDRENDRRPNEPAIFNPTKKDGVHRMYSELYNMFRIYIYNERDEKAFFSPVWRRMTGVSQRTAEYLRSNRTMKIMAIDNGRLRVVTFLIDPLRVFHDMLRLDDQGERRNYVVNVEDVIKLSKSNYIYKVLREIKSAKNESVDDQIINEILKKVETRPGNRNS